MGRVLTFLIVVVVAVAALGFYLDWFHVSTSGTGKQVKVELSVDKDKIERDKDKAEEQLKKTGEQIAEKARDVSADVKKKFPSSGETAPEKK